MPCPTTQRLNNVPRCHQLEFRQSAIYITYAIYYYLNIINTKKELTKLRISAHSLQIEKAHNTDLKKIPIEKMFCLHCTAGDVEDEIHFLMKCSSLAENKINFNNSYKYTFSQFSKFAQN